MTRTDVHSPKNLITEDYEYVYAYDLGTPGCLVGIAQTEWWQEICRNKANIHGSGQCDHCGASLRYIAILKHTPTGQYIEVGETCLDNRFAVATAEFHKLRKAAQLDREKQRIVTAWAKYQEDHSQVDWEKLHASENTFIADVLRKGRQYGNLSDRQLDAIVKAYDKDNAPKAPKAPRVNVPTGKVTITGKIVSIKWKDSDYGGAYKITVVIGDESGESAVWGSLARSIGDAEVGDIVSFGATVTASDDDPTFGFFKRPTKAVIVKSRAGETTEPESQESALDRIFPNQ